MKTVDTIYVNQITIICPHCGEILDDFIEDPRGEAIICDSCSNEFIVAQNPHQEFEL